MKLRKPYEIEELDETRWKRWMWGEEAGIVVKKGLSNEMLACVLKYVKNAQDMVVVGTFT